MPPQPNEPNEPIPTGAPAGTTNHPTISQSDMRPSHRPAQPPLIPFGLPPTAGATGRSGLRRLAERISATTPLGRLGITAGAVLPVVLLVAVCATLLVALPAVALRVEFAGWLGGSSATNGGPLQTPSTAATGTPGSITPTPGATASAAPGSPSRPGGPPPRAWQIVTSPNPGDRLSELRGVGVISSSDVWAVGDYTRYSQNNLVTHNMALHWNGSTWASIPAADERNGPNQSIGSNRLLAVGGTSFGDVWAVGDFVNVGESQGRTLAEHWNGSSWTVYPTPTIGQVWGSLASVAVLSASDAWAVGTGNSGEFLDTQIIEHWDGSQWSMVSLPAQLSGEATGLSGVAAISATDVWAVGEICPDLSAPNAHWSALTEHWDGTTWTVVSNPGSDMMLNAVSARGSGNVWAVGAGGPPGSTVTDTMHWNGSRWAVASRPAPGPQQTILTGVTIAPDGTAWAVGTWSISPPASFVEHWDGHGWALVQAPAPPNDVDGGPNWQLLGAASSASAVWAVGYELPSSAGETNSYQTLIERY